MKRDLTQLVAKQMIEIAPIGVVYLDNKFRIIYENLYLQKMLGGNDKFFKDNIKGMNFFDLPNIVATGMVQALKARFVNPPFPEPLRLKYKSMIRSNKHIEVDVLVAPINPAEDDDSAVPDCDWVVLVQNISIDRQRRQIMKELYTAIQNSDSYIIMTDSEGKFTYANPAFLKATGYSMKDLDGQTPRLLKTGTHTDEYYQELWETITSGQSWSGEFANRKKNGEVFHVRAIISPVYSGNGNPKIVAYVGVQEDISNTRIMLDELERQRSVFKAIFEENHAGMALHEMVRDESGKAINYRFIEVNQAFYRYTGLAPGTAPGKKVTELIPGVLEDSADWLTRYERVCRTGEVDHAFAVHSEALNRAFDITTFKVGPDRFTSSFVDVSEREQMIKREEAWDFLKSEFMAIATHEMRTPLAIALGYIGLLDENKHELETEFAMWIKNAYEKMLELRELINSTLDLFELRVNPHILKEKFQPVNISYLTVYVIEELRRTAKQKGVYIIPQVENLTMIVNGHYDLIKRAIHAILTNAIKFSDPGGMVKVSVFSKEGKCRIVIEDNGPGIPVNQLNAIFRRFEQLEEASVREHGGLGLGLPLALDIMTLHEGDIVVESQLGVGSKFTILFDCEECAI